MSVYMAYIKKSKRRKYLGDKSRNISRHRKNNQIFYNSKQWRSTRRSYVNEYPLCEVCEVYGKVVVGDDVHHIIEWQEGGDKYNENNLLHVCKEHHRELTKAYKLYSMVWCKVAKRLRSVVDITQTMV